ncbi:hypothetical protein BTS2_3303 [Bacillus sp. TS-2]|nr:hypothetical protein BTS2_3303 [Bacillus sp. TS-2]
MFATLTNLVVFLALIIIGIVVVLATLGCAVNYLNTRDYEMKKNAIHFMICSLFYLPSSIMVIVFRLI